MLLKVIAHVFASYFAGVKCPEFSPLIVREILLGEATVRAESRMFDKTNVILVAKVAHFNVNYVYTVIEMTSYFR